MFSMPDILSMEPTVLDSMVGIGDSVESMEVSMVDMDIPTPPVPLMPDMEDGHGPDVNKSNMSKLPPNPLLPPLDGLVTTDSSEVTDGPELRQLLLPKLWPKLVPPELEDG